MPLIFIMTGNSPDPEIAIVGSVLGSVRSVNIIVHNMGNIDVGAANADKNVILGITWGDDDPRTISTVTVGGVSLSEKVVAVLPLAQDTAAAIWAGDIGSLSGNQLITVTFSDAVNASGVSGVAVSGLESLTPVDTASDTVTSGDATLAGLEAPSGGFTFACANGDFRINAIGWTNLTERADLESGTNTDDHRHGAAWDLGIRASQDTVVDVVGGANGIATVGACFR